MSVGAEADAVSSLDVVSFLLGAGCIHLREHRDLEAMRLFDEVLALEPGNRTAIAGRGRALRALVPRWHFAMINDTGRNRKFDEVLRAVVRPDSTVLDIGSGSGLLAMLAARHGARRVITCESSPPLAQVAAEIVALNRLDHRVSVVAKHSWELAIPGDLPDRVDVVVAEVVDCGLLGEGVLPTLRHARGHLLKPGGTLIPRSARLLAAVVESRQIVELNRVDTYRGLDLSRFNALATGEYFPVRLDVWDHRMMTRPATVFEFDFERGLLDPRTAEIEVEVRASGHGDGVVMWFEIQLDATTWISNAPGTRSHWLQAFQCLPCRPRLERGRVARLLAQHDDRSVWLGLA